MQARMLSHGQPVPRSFFIPKAPVCFTFASVCATINSRKTKNAKSCQKLSEVGAASTGQSESELILLCKGQRESPRRRDATAQFGPHSQTSWGIPENRFKFTPYVRISLLDSSLSEIGWGLLLRKLENPMLRTNSESPKHSSRGNMWEITALRMQTTKSVRVTKWFL